MNNRIIKFRAWFDGPKLMGDVITLKGSNRTDYDANMWDEVTAECRINGRQQFYSSSNFKLLQSTGIRDKNGKEIYEGDVIDLESRFLYVVTFEDAKFVCYHVISDYGKWGDLHRLFDYDFSQYKWQVIGNIYEHPHLLNQEK